MVDEPLAFMTPRADPVLSHMLLLQIRDLPQTVGSGQELRLPVLLTNMGDAFASVRHTGAATMLIWDASGEGPRGGTAGFVSTVGYTADLRPGESVKLKSWVAVRVRRPLHRPRLAGRGRRSLKAWMTDRIQLPILGHEDTEPPLPPGHYQIQASVLATVKVGGMSRTGMVNSPFYPLEVVAHPGTRRAWWARA